MITSERRKFIFKHTPRTAGKTIIYALRNYIDFYKGGHSSLPSVISGMKDVYKIDKNGGTIGKGKDGVFTKLMGLRGTKLDYWKLSDDISNYFVFTFVRNPFVRLVSGFFHRKNNGNFGKYEFSKKGFKRLIQDQFEGRRPVIPQLCPLVDEENKLLCDFVGKYERLQSDFDLVCDQLGIQRIKLEEVIDYLNPSIRDRREYGNYKDYYDQETIKMVQKMYEKDFEVFGYDKELQ